MNKRSFRILCLTFAALAPLTLLPGGALAADEYVIPNGTTITIDEHGACTAITNNSGADLMAPTKSINEWSTGGNSFLEKAPLDIEMLDCCTGGQQNLSYSGGPFHENYFGISSSVDGDWAVTSAQHWPSYNLYFFKRTGGVWSEHSKISLDYFSDVGIPKIDGDTVATSGGYIYHYNGTAWSQQGGKLGGGLTISEFDISGDTVVFTDTSWTDNTWPAGRVVTYDRSGGIWTLSNTMYGSWKKVIGKALSLDGDTLIASYNLGMWAYTRSGAGWAQQGELITSPPTPPIGYGPPFSSSDISGDTVILAYKDLSVSGQSGAGAVYVFTRSGSTWTQQAKLDAGPPNYMEYFGTYAALSGDLIVASEPEFYQFPNGEVGRVHVFTRSGTTWTKDSVLVGGPNANFGEGLDTDGLSIFSAAPGKDGSTNSALFMDCAP